MKCCAALLAYQSCLCNASDRLSAGAELTFSYGEPNDGSAPDSVHQPCLCNSPDCLGFLPLQQGSTG